ncbi:MAG: heavy metal translocating P-type ATPase [Peptoniphilaceae bacterium]|nr:heavy metal translocating P-type ATPase [Peptoniphilaceae bacterium]
MKQKFDVSGMTCAACQANVTRAVKKLGAKEVNVSLLTNSMNVDFDPDKITEEEIIQSVKNIGYDAKVKSNSVEKNETDEINEDIETKEIKKRLIISFLFLIPLMYISMGHMIGFNLPHFFEGYEGSISFSFTQFLLTIPIIYINRVFFIRGFKGLLRKSFNMDTLIALGSSAAFVYGIYSIYKIGNGLGVNNESIVNQYRHNLYFESSAMILTLITLGKYLESISKGKTTASLKSLMKLKPKTANIILQGEEINLPIDELKINDIVIVKPGEQIPVDGIIIEGSSLVDESAITGESIPIEKNAGDKVISATINQHGTFKFKATSVGEDTTISKIIELVNDANESKAPIAKLADKISAIFVPIVIAIALLTFLVWFFLLSKEFDFALNMSISVLVISCPCALGLATPMAIMVSTGKAAKFGILFKNAESLENLQNIDTVLLDKTGTITEGKPKVTDVITDLKKDEFLKIAYSLEKYSEHSLSKAIVEYSNEKGITPYEISDFNAVPGKGIYAKINGEYFFAGNKLFMDINNKYIGEYEDLSKEISSSGKTSMFFSNEKKVIGIIAVMDLPKNSSLKAIDILKKMGIDVRMVTGDNKDTAKAIEKSLNLNNSFSEVLPEEKDNVVLELQKLGKKVLMVGDGINDSPALARADIGIAIGSGTDVAIESSDVVLINGDLLDIINAIDLSKSTIKNIKENLFWAFFYNFLFIPVAVGLFYPTFGLKLNPMFAAAAMSFSSVFVSLNSLRLSKFKPKYENVKKQTKEDNMFGTKSKEINVEGMMCDNCASHVKKALENLEEVKKANVSLEDKKAIIKYKGDLENSQIENAVKNAGYSVKEIKEL